MTSTRHMSAVAAVIGLLLLTGCGAAFDIFGGDRRDPGEVVSDIEPPTDAEPALSAVAGASSANPDRPRQASERAALALPRFGSVTQSSNSTSGVTSDIATADFDGRDIRVTIDRQQGSKLTFDSAAEAADSVDFDPGVEGYSGRVYALADPTDAGISVAVVHTGWNNADPMDYLAGGYWVYLEVDLGAPELFRVGVGAFADGPELRGNPSLPSLGTASYEGPATGLYGYFYGSDRDDRPAESAEFGQYSAVAELTADFAARTVSGCIGCRGGLAVAAIGTTPGGEEFESSDDSMPARLRLGPAAFDSAGTFSNRDVTVEFDGRTIEHSHGAWGGRFSEIADAARDPRLVAGTAGAEWRESDGSLGTFVGAWSGTKNP